MYCTLQAYGRRKIIGLGFSKDANEQIDLISPKPFNRIASPAHSAQASAASTQCVFSDRGSNEGSQRQSFVSGTLERTRVIRTYVWPEIEAL